MGRIRLGRLTVGRSLIAAVTGGALIAGMAAAASATTGGPAGRTASAGFGLSAVHGHAAPRAGFMVQPHAVKLPPGEKMACGLVKRPGEAACQAVVTTSSGLAPALSGVPSIGYGPNALRSAYALKSASLHDGGGRTVAIVDAFNNPNLAKNLASYRHHFNLPACTLATHCLRIVNQNGGKTLPGVPKVTSPNFGWTVEESLDLDMVSAICPHCHILLVEAKNPMVGNLGTAEDTAVRMGARFVSNSWSGPEFFGQDSANHFFNHPGAAIVFASGDFGYGTMYPTSTQYVTAVGGTKLVKAANKRGWSETVWGSTKAGALGTGSGCSFTEAKPSWQKVDDVQPDGCLNRTENDVSADAAPATGVATYDTYKTGGTFFRVGGTSVATPIIASIYALAGSPAHGAYPASYPYRHRASFYGVTAGANGHCESFRQYLCHGEPGYDGPTGVGTPHGIGGFSKSGVDPVTVLDPGTRTVASGAAFQLTIHSTDSDTLAKSLSYTATGLPAGLSIAPVSNSLNGSITGTLPTETTAASFSVKVTATDTHTGTSNSTVFHIYVIPSLTDTADAPAAGQVMQQFNTANCLTAAGTATGDAVSTQTCPGTNQNWQLVSGSAPGDAETLQLGGTSECLGLTPAHLAELQDCASPTNDKWFYFWDFTSTQLDTVFFNPASGLCLHTASPQDNATSCASVANNAQSWVAPATLVVSGKGGGQCLAMNGTTPQLAPCSSSSTDPTQSWLELDGHLQNTASTLASTPCLAINGLLDGNKAVMEDCGTVDSTGAGVWALGPGGQLINAVSGKCLDDVGGTFELMECYGQPGEVWGLN